MAYFIAMYTSSCAIWPSAFKCSIMNTYNLETLTKKNHIFLQSSTYSQLLALIYPRSSFVWQYSFISTTFLFCCSFYKFFVCHGWSLELLFVSLLIKFSITQLNVNNYFCLNYLCYFMFCKMPYHFSILIELELNSAYCTYKQIYTSVLSTYYGIHQSYYLACEKY